MPVAPTPPTKPTPPVAPTLTPAGIQDTSEHTPAATPAPAASGQNTSTSISPEVSAAVKKIEEMGKAFQGVPTKPKASEQTNPAATDDKVNSVQPAPATVGNAQNVVSAQTVVSAEPSVAKSKPSIVTFIPFFVGVVVLVAVVLVGMRLFSKKPGKIKQTDARIDYTKNKVAQLNNNDNTEIIIAPPDVAPKSQRNFETRV